MPVPQPAAPASLRRSHVDVLLLARTALGSALPITSRRHVSLASLMGAVLGKRLDKEEQCSAWGERPLRPAQLAYAAADAHALVALHAELLRRRAGLDTPFWVEHMSGAPADACLSDTAEACCGMDEQQTSGVCMLGESSARRFGNISCTHALPVSSSSPPPIRTSGRLTDVAAFHPNTRGRSSRVAAAAADPGLRRSSQPRRALRALDGGSGGGGGGGSRAPSEIAALDMNADYLYNSYLGRALPQGGRAAVVRAAAAQTGRSEAGRTPRCGPVHAVRACPASVCADL